MNNIAGSDVKKYRERNNLSQQMFGDMIKMSKESVCKWETGRSIPLSTQLLITSIFKDFYEVINENR